MTPRKYQEPQGDPHLGEDSARDLEVLSDHIEQSWGEVSEVFHEIHSEYVHIDLHMIPATPRRAHHLVITTGMSDRPMIASNGERYYCELLLALPPEWPIHQKDFGDEKFWWPYRHLKQTARFPHVVKTLFWYGHTLANGDPPAPFHPSAPFCGTIVSIPTLAPEGALKVEVRPNKEVFFFSMLPIYEADLRYAWKEGSKALFEELDRINVTELIDTNRQSAV